MDNTMSDAEVLEKMISDELGWKTEQLGQVLVHYDPQGRMRGARPKYTRDIAAAWMLIDNMIANGKRPKISRVAENEWRVEVDHEFSVVYHENICMAIALAWIGWIDYVRQK